MTVKLECPRCGQEWRPITLPERHEAERRIAIQHVLDEAERVYGVSGAEFKQRYSGNHGNHSKQQRKAFQGMCWAALELRLLGLQLKEIGQILGNRDHSTVLHLIRLAGESRVANNSVPISRRKQ